MADHFVFLVVWDNHHSPDQDWWRGECGDCTWKSGWVRRPEVAEQIMGAHQVETRREAGAR